MRIRPPEMRRWRRALAVGSLAALLAGCSQGPRVVPQPGPDGEFNRAKTEYERGHMVEAITLFEAFEKAYPGSQYIDDVLYLLGKAHQGNKEQILARQEFRRVLDEFPRSPYAEDALFEFAQSWYLSVRGPTLDPEPAEEALRGFRTYLGRYPQGKYADAARAGETATLGLLARKDYLNGETYLKLKQYAPARRYFEKSLEQWGDSPVSALALDGLARSYEGTQDPANARATYQRLIEHLADDPSRFEQGAKLARHARRSLAALPASGS